MGGGRFSGVGGGKFSGVGGGSTSGVAGAKALEGGGGAILARATPEGGAARRRAGGGGGGGARFSGLDAAPGGGLGGDRVLEGDTTELCTWDSVSRLSSYIGKASHDACPALSSSNLDLRRLFSLIVSELGPPIATTLSSYTSITREQHATNIC